MKIIKNISIFIYSVIFIITTSGFPLYQHICNSCDIEEISYFFPEKEHCIHKFDNQKLSCCNYDESTCKNKSEKDLVLSKNQSNNKCCTDKSNFLKINLNFLHSNIDYNKILQFFDLLYFYTISKNCFYDNLKKLTVFKDNFFNNFHYPFPFKLNCQMLL